MQFTPQDVEAIVKFRELVMIHLGQLHEESDLTPEQSFGSALEIAAHIFLSCVHLATDDTQQQMKDSLCEMLDQLKDVVQKELPLEHQIMASTFQSGVSKIQGE